MSKLKGKNYFGFQAQIKSADSSSSEETKKLTIKGFASTPQIDRYNHIVDPKAFKEALETYMTNPVLLLGHEQRHVIGLVTEGKITNKGLYITGIIEEDGSKETEVTIKRIEQRKLRTMSIGYRPLEVRFQQKNTGVEIPEESYWDLPWESRKEFVRKITKLDLVEISVVSTPANAGAIFSVEKSIKSFLDHRESVMLKGGDVSEEEKNLYLITSNDMPKPKDMQKKAADDAELKNEEIEEELEDDEIEEEEKNVDTNNADDGETDDDEVEEDSAESADDSEEGDAEKSADDESENDDETEEVEDAEVEAGDDSEEVVEASYDGLKNMLKTVGKMVLKQEKSTELNIDIKSLVDLKDQKATSSLIKGLLTLSVQLQAKNSELEEKLGKAPDLKSMVTSKHYQTDEEQAKQEKGANSSNQKLAASQNAIKSIFARVGVNLRK